MGAGQWGGACDGVGVRGAGGGAGGVRPDSRHDTPEEDGRPRAAPCGPARHGKDGARARRLPGARQQGAWLQLLRLLAQISYNRFGGIARVLFLSAVLPCG